jgi:hypothetical protein
VTGKGGARVKASEIRLIDQTSPSIEQYANSPLPDPIARTDPTPKILMRRKKVDYIH